MGMGTKRVEGGEIRMGIAGKERIHEENALFRIIFRFHPENTFCIQSFFYKNRVYKNINLRFSENIRTS